METIGYSHLVSVYEASEDIEILPIPTNFQFRQWQKWSSMATMRLLSVALTVGIFSLAGEALALQKVGSNGREVASIQRCLKKLGFFNGPVNGRFASLTQRAVIGFQRANRLTADGVVGGGTQRALQRACQGGTSASTGGELRLGSRGAAVSRLQQNLRRLRYFNGPNTGYFGSETRQAVIRLQRANGIFADGIVGSQTAQVLRTGSNGSSGYPVLSQGNTGQAVTRLQQRLRQLGYFPANPTGNFKGLTRDAVMAFQRNARLPVTGVVNQRTWNALEGYSQVANRPSLSTQQVRDLQQRLRDLGYFNANPNGSVGAMTRESILKFQRDNGLYTDGIADLQILQAVRRVWDTRYAYQPSRAFLSVGDRNDNVRAVQQRLSELGFFNGSPDGYFDEYTRTSVASFQQYYQLNPTGSIDGQTWQALGLSNSSVASLPNTTMQNRYVVVVPINNPSTLNQVRRYVPNAFTDRGGLGSFVNAGAFGDRSTAERLSKMLRSNGLDARVQYF
ncbi:peptidoglycan-binding protein [Nostoc sp. TCL26-01]|uniref:peptidoglycan-binding domain-containing protein n=1 Tax=Nostoc sp. TCL26-01 TaxID=2576904 RepID=UPI0015BDE60C|nr:peptidoglycan-binding protein [Nostoc sp. TCL26-01]QLE58091.1 peptidoglycan-binding protein [Nostoc sp. TCL26-01]